MKAASLLIQKDSHQISARRRKFYHSQILDKKEYQHSRKKQNNEDSNRHIELERAEDDGALPAHRAEILAQRC